MTLTARSTSVLMHGEYEFKAKRSNGRTFVGESKNYVPTVGRVSFVNAYFGFETFPAMHMSIVSSAQQGFATGQYKADDDFSGSLLWAELTEYIGSRKAVTWSSDAVDSKIETDFETFTFAHSQPASAGLLADRISGVFLASGSVKTGVTTPTSGDELFSVAPWMQPAPSGFKDGLAFGLDELSVKYRMQLFHGGPFDTFSGGATAAARNDMLNVAFRGATVTNTWFVGFIDATSFTTIRDTDTLGSHPGWFELTGDFLEGDRVGATFSTTSTNGSVSTDVVSLIAIQPGKVIGMFLTDQATGTGGLLHSAARFTGVFTPGQDYRKYDRLSFEYGVSMSDVSYGESI